MALETCTICGRLTDIGVLVEATTDTDATSLVGRGPGAQAATTEVRRDAGVQRAVLCHDCSDSRPEREHSTGA